MNRSWLALASLALASVAGCAPEIGDECSSSTDCSVQGDRLCDITQPGGYCTVFNCEPDTCPEEAQCVVFDQQEDAVCAVTQQWSRFERTFCMRRCGSNGDCRGGYICADMREQPNPWSGAIVDINPEGSKICISPSSGVKPGDMSDVCNPYDGGFPDGESPTADAAAPDSGVQDASMADGADGGDSASTD